MSQFAFLQAEFPDIFAHAARAENLANSDPRAAAFRPMRLTARFDRRSTPRFDVVAPSAHSRAAKTRMNTRVSPAHDGPNETRGARACGPGGGGSHYAFRQPHIDRRRLSVAAPAVFAGMRTGGWRDVAVDARMVIGVEPSGALGTVIGTIAEASPFLRQ
jgi:hypothetical protein